jgi:hypothetical protein
MAVPILIRWESQVQRSSYAQTREGHALKRDLPSDTYIFIYCTDTAIVELTPPVPEIVTV